MMDINESQFRVNKYKSDEYLTRESSKISHLLKKWNQLSQTFGYKEEENIFRGGVESKSRETISGMFASLLTDLPTLSAIESDRNNTKLCNVMSNTQSILISVSRCVRSISESLPYTTSSLSEEMEARLMNYYEEGKEILESLTIYTEKYVETIHEKDYKNKFEQEAELTEYTKQAKNMFELAALAAHFVIHSSDLRNSTPLVGVNYNRNEDYYEEVQSDAKQKENDRLVLRNKELEKNVRDLQYEIEILNSQIQSKLILKIVTQPQVPQLEIKPPLLTLSVSQVLLLQPQTLLSQPNSKMKDQILQSERREAENEDIEKTLQKTREAVEIKKERNNIPTIMKEYNPIIEIEDEKSSPTEQTGLLSNSSDSILCSAVNLCMLRMKDMMAVLVTKVLGGMVVVKESKI